MKTQLLSVALVITVAGPAFAQSAPTRFAIEHLNQAIDSTMERIPMPTTTAGLQVTTSGDTALSEAMDVVGDDVMGFVTVYPGDPTYAQDVFSRLAQE